MKYALSFFFTAVFFLASVPVYADMVTKNRITEEYDLTGELVSKKESDSPSDKESPPVTGFHHNVAIKKLPPPQKDLKGISLMQAVEKRRTNRLIKEEVLSDQEISNILWVAWGINDRDHHTTPTYLDTIINIYVSLPDGVWLYNPYKNLLKQVLTEPLAKQYDLVTTEFFYAILPDDFSYMLLGSVYQNVGLYCASRELFNVMRFSRAHILEDKFPLPEGFKLIMSQGIGLPR